MKINIHLHSLFSVYPSVLIFSRRGTLFRMGIVNLTISLKVNFKGCMVHQNHGMILEAIGFGSVKDIEIIVKVVTNEFSVDVLDNLCLP